MVAVKLALILFVGTAVALPAVTITKDELLRFVQHPATAYIINYARNDDPSRGYEYDVDQSDGQRKYEQAEIVNAGTDQESIAVKGYFSYLGPDGIIYTVGYTADENGFQPEGEHLPPAANVKRRTPQLGIPSSAVASLAGGGLGK